MGKSSSSPKAALVDDDRQLHANADDRHHCFVATGSPGLPPGMVGIGSMLLMAMMSVLLPRAHEVTLSLTHYHPFVVTRIFMPNGPRYHPPMIGMSTVEQAHPGQGWTDR
jgi:hypothetical protein